MVLSELTGVSNTQTSIFQCKSNFVPQAEPEPDVFEEDEKDEGVIITPPLTDYLPGERLLQRVNKERKKANQKRRPNNLSVDDVHTISRSLSKLANQLS